MDMDILSDNSLRFLVFLRVPSLESIKFSEKEMSTLRDVPAQSVKELFLVIISISFNRKLRFATTFETRG
jgi:hypothetical protein